MKKAERLNGIIFTLKDNGRLTAKQIADKFEVSERTIYRDIDALSQLKVPIIAYEGLNGGYEIESDYFMPSIKLNENEAVLLLMVLKMGGDLNFPNNKSDYELLKGKIINTLNKNEYNNIEKLLDRITFYVSNINPADYVDGVLEGIIASLNHRKQLKIKYYTPATDKSASRIISPQSLFFEGGGWYLSAYCHLKNEKRVFRLDRISKIDVLDSDNDYMDVEIKSSTDKFKTCTYTLEMNNSIYRVLKDNDYLKEATIENQGDLIKLSITTKMEQEIVRLVLENPNTITALGPSEFLMKITHLITQLKNKYNS